MNLCLHKKYYLKRNNICEDKIRSFYKSSSIVAAAIAATAMQEKIPYAYI